MWESIGSGWFKTGTSQDDVYYDADNVTFSPDHAGTVTLQEQLAPGKMTVNGETCTMRGRKIRPGDEVTFAGHTLHVQSAQ